MPDLVVYSNGSAFLESFPQQLAAKFSDFAPNLVRVRGRAPAQTTLFAEEEETPDLFLVHLGDDPEAMLDFIESRRLCHRAPVMILAPNEQWAMRAYELEVQFYQLSPPDLNRISEIILRRFMHPATRIAPAQFTMRTSSGTVVADFDQIIHVEYDNHHLTIHLQSGQSFTSTTLRISFGDAAAPLLSDPRFVRTHASHLANIAHVVRFSSTALTMDTGTVVPISYAKKAEVKRKFSGFYSA